MSEKSYFPKEYLLKHRYYDFSLSLSYLFLIMISTQLINSSQLEFEPFWGIENKILDNLKRSGSNAKPCDFFHTTSLEKFK